MPNETKLWKAFSRFIRLRDAQPETGIVKCITCPNVRHWTKIDCGHGLPRQHKMTKYNESNNHGQCKHCNGFSGGKREIYKAEVDRRYGLETWDKLEIASRQLCKRSQGDIDLMEMYYRKEADRIQKEKGL